jgi:hypothetical protein
MLTDNPDDFDALEAKIRGEEILSQEEAKLLKERRAVDEEFKKLEVEKRLKDLKESKPSKKRK